MMRWSGGIVLVLAAMALLAGAATLTIITVVQAAQVAHLQSRADTQSEASHAGCLRTNARSKDLQQALQIIALKEGSQALLNIAGSPDFAQRDCDELYPLP